MTLPVRVRLLTHIIRSTAVVLICLRFFFLSFWEEGGADRVATPLPSHIIHTRRLAVFEVLLYRSDEGIHISSCTHQGHEYLVLSLSVCQWVGRLDERMVHVFYRQRRTTTGFSLFAVCCGGHRGCFLLYVRFKGVLDGRQRAANVICRENGNHAHSGSVHGYVVTATAQCLLLCRRLKENRGLPHL